MSPDEDETVVIECGGCGDELEVGATCDECGWSEAAALGDADAQRETASASGPEPVYWKTAEAGTMPRHEPAYCPHCVAFLRWFSTRDEARAYERTLDDHPFESCVKRQAKLNGSDEWRLRHEAKKFGSSAATRPVKPRVPVTLREGASA